MNFNKKIIKDRLKNVPLNKQVWVYSAEIILEFLNHTFLPTEHFLSARGKISAKTEKIKPIMFDDVLCVKRERVSINEIYDKYLIFRENRDYTTEVETKYKFSLMLNKLTYIKNGWQFFKTRYSREQLMMMGPMKLRGDVESNVRKEYPIKTSNLEGTQVEMKMKDLQSEEEPEEQEWTEAEELEWIEVEEQARAWEEAIAEDFDHDSEDTTEWIDVG